MRGVFLTDNGVEYKTERDEGFRLDRETGDVTPWEGVRIFWRFEGQRRWSKVVLVPDPLLGQTVETLEADAAKIAQSLADKPPMVVS